MNTNTAKNALVFLSRSKLDGFEMAAFQEVVQALNVFVEEKTPEEPTTSTTPTDNEESN